MAAPNAIRYSEAELLEFKIHIEEKLEKAFVQLDSLKDKVNSVSEASGNDGDLMDDSSNLQDLDLLYVMIGRQQKHIQDLKNALIRIHNRSYGLCVVTGELIDKRRLMAVPATTKSIAGKNMNPVKSFNKEPEKKKIKVASAPTSFSRIIKKTNESELSKPKKEEHFDDDLELGYNELKNMKFDELENDYIEE